MGDDELSVQPSRRGRSNALIVSLVVVTVAVLSGASAFTIHRLHLLRPNQPLSTTVSMALPLLTYAAIAGVLVVLLGHLATARIERESQRLMAAAGAATAQRSESESALRRSEERFQLAARASNDVLWDWDFATGAIWRNDGMRRVFGHAEVSSRAEEREALLHPDDRARVASSLDDFLHSTRDTWTAEYRFRRADATYAWVLDRGIAVRGPDGRALRLIGSMLDITDRKEAERLKSDFVSFVSHQLRTPIAGMNWMLELAAEAEGLPPQAREYIGEARESAARLSTLVNHLLDIARLESGRTVLERRPVDLGRLTKSVVGELQALIADKRQTLLVEAPDTPPVAGDPHMLRQVIANLMSNAVKYTPDGGRIDVRLAQQDSTVEWLVHDTGIGIPRAARDRLFEKFFRAENAVSKEAEGSGLGLHLVRLIIEQTGGHVRVESEEGQGAVFAFVLPVWQSGGDDA